MPMPAFEMIPREPLIDFPPIAEPQPRITAILSTEDLAETRKLFYLASPYSKYPGGPERAHEVVCRIAGQLVKEGVAVFCPIAHTHPIATFGHIDLYSHDIWLPVDEPLMRACDAMLIVEMAGWQESYGIAKEIEFFVEAEKPVWRLSLKDWHVLPYRL